MEIEKDLAYIAQQGLEKDGENIRFRKFLKAFDNKTVDPAVHAINEQVTAQIDCTACGNCCKTFEAAIEDGEAGRLAAFMGITKAEFIEKYVEIDDLFDISVMHSSPCIFLENNKCKVNDIKPYDCCDYPYTHKSDFKANLLGISESYGTCPIVYNVMEQLKKQLEFK